MHKYLVTLSDGSEFEIEGPDRVQTRLNAYYIRARDFRNLAITNIRYVTDRWGSNSAHCIEN